jgi:two-component system, sporulation sensor kinase A
VLGENMNHDLNKVSWQKLKLIISILIILLALEVPIVWFVPHPWSVVLITLLVILEIAFILRLMIKGKKLINRHNLLLQEENLLSTLIHSLPDFVCFKDGEGRWLKVNQFGRELYELENISYKGKTDGELGELVPFFKDAFAYCINSDEETWKATNLTRAEESFYVPSGELKTFDVIKVPLFYDNNVRKGLVTIGRDISQQKIAEEMLLRKEKLSIAGELAAGIAHEIRNPLTSIKGFIQMMETSEKASKKYLTIMASEIERINHIVEELLLLAKPQMRKLETFRAEELLQYVVNVMSHEARIKGIMISSQIDCPTQVLGDKNQLTQVFINIVKNAIDSMKSGTITVKCKEEQNNVTISIVDEGIGIPPDRLKRLGEPFFTLKEKGMGLGLTISRKILQDHKGTLQIESEVNKGTTVKVQLPIV